MRNRVLGAGLALLGAVAAMVVPGDGHAQGRDPIACGTFYTVARGDTLHDISVRAYRTANYQAIFDANRDILRSVAVIEVGDRLLIPCLDGSGFQTREQALAALNPIPTAGAETDDAPQAGDAVTALTPTPALSPPSAATAAPGTALPFARILVLDEAAPFAGRRLPEGGMVTELVSRAMQRAPSPVDYEVVFEDQANMRKTEIEARGFDLGFPVTRPDCSRSAVLPPDERVLCTDFLYSDPVVEIETRFYVRAGNELVAASDPGQFAGLTVCRPAGAFAGQLAEEELVEPRITLVRAPRARVCLDQLVEGAVDVVILSGPSPDDPVRQPSVGAGVDEIEVMRRTRPIHVVAPRGNERGRAFLLTLNRGLAEIRSSGEWAIVVENHLEQHRAAF